jgi:hypothetical protein
VGGPKGPKRGRKTHRADIMQNRGERREPEVTEEMRADAAEDVESRRQEQARDEHPTRKTQAGYMSRGGHGI